MAVGADGSVYVADAENNRIRRVGPEGLIATVAGTGTSGFSGDGGPATEAQLSLPMGVAAGSDGSLYVADTYNGRVRQLTPSGIMLTIAGDGSTCWGSDPCGDGGPAARAALGIPQAVAVGSDGSVYVATSVGVPRLPHFGSVNAEKSGS